MSFYFKEGGGRFFLGGVFILVLKIDGDDGRNGGRRLEKRKITQ